jgi:hypothetical protein
MLAFPATGAEISPEVFGNGRYAYQYAANRNRISRTAMLRLMIVRIRREDTVVNFIVRNSPSAAHNAGH